MSGSDTLPRLLLRNAGSLGGRTAIREKRHGIWQAVTWAEHAAAVRVLAGGLAASGFQRGDRLAVLGDNRRALYQAQLAAMCLGGAVVPCWPDAEPAWLRHVLADAGVSIVVAEDHDQVEKLLEIKDDLPAVHTIIHTDPRGVHHGELAFLRPILSIVSSGATTQADVAGPIGTATADEVCLIPYVTPADGPPVAVPLTHAQLLAAATAVTRAADVRQSDEYFSYLPMAWAAEAIYGTALSLLVGFAISCPEDPETARRDLRELGPTILLAPPRIWQSLLAEVETKASHATPMKRSLCARFLPDAYAAAPPGRGGFLAEWLVAAPVRDQLGLGRLRWAHMGGLAAPPHLPAFFTALGVNLAAGPSPAEQTAMTGLATDVPTPLALADGTTAEARGIEAALCHNTFVGDAIVIADGSGRLGALLAIDQTAITDWAQALSLSFTTPAELLALPEVRQLIGEQVAAGNATLPPQQRIERYRLLDAPPAGASAEASLSRVLQRRIALQGQASQGEGLFADPPGPGIEVVQAIAARMRKEAA